MAAPRKTGWLTHERFYWHDSGLESHSPFVQPLPSNEGPETKRRFANLVATTPLADALTPLKPRAVTDEEILRVHTPGYLARLKAVSAAPGGGLVGHELHLGQGGFEIAALSAGGVLAATEAVLQGEVANAYALVRPPGHHADADAGHGFCALGNVAIAAAAILARGLVQRVAVVDIDVHHGNGTEGMFLQRSDLLFVSLHQDKLYPLATGGVDTVGEGAGRGHNLNCPLPPGCGIGAYSYAFERVVEPALRAYRPDIILVSCGFDCAFLDPLGRMMLTSDGFRELTRRLRELAEELCQGRLVYAHEGGYSPAYVPFCGLAVLEELSGVASGVQDPFVADVGSPDWQACQPHQAAAVDRAAENLKLALLK